MTRARAAGALAVVTGVLLVAATLTAYASLVLFDSDRFASRATSALQAQAVRELAAERITDGLVLPEQPDLVAARPVIAGAVSGVVGGSAFASLFRRAVRDVHAAVFRSDRDTVTLTLVDVGLVVAAALQELHPELAARLESGERVEMVSRDLGSVTSDLMRVARDVRLVTFVLAALTLAAAAGALLVGRDRRRVASQLGIAAIVAGVTIAAAEVVARALVLDRVGDPDERAAAAAVWDAFLGDLRTAAWVLAGAGAVVAAAAASLLRPIDVEEPLLAAWRAVTTEPRSTALRVARGVAFVAAGALTVAAPAAALRIAATLVGLYVLYKGLEALLRLVARPEPAPTPRRERVRRIAVPAVAALVIAGAAVAFVTGGGVDEPAAAPVSRCNGDAELCDRALDEVVLPATHNSMAVSVEGWFAALQDRTIAQQLEDGIRGLLLDTHYADRLPNGRTRTYFGSQEEVARTIQRDGVSPQTVAAAERLRERLGFRGAGERGLYLCHTFCELGATPLSKALEDIHEFLATHPGEVLVAINQDAVTPADFAAAVDDEGLTRYVFEPPRGTRWPTLREMIDSGRRLVLLAENQAGAAPWYQPAFDRLAEDTPFRFTRVPQLTDAAALEASCAVNRGPAGAPLLIVNHWINTDPLPRPSHAAAVNAYDPLLARARACERVRGQLPNLLAVDFYTRGDLFAVVDALNQVGEGAP